MLRFRSGLLQCYVYTILCLLICIQMQFLGLLQMYSCSFRASCCSSDLFSDIQAQFKGLCYTSDVTAVSGAFTMLVQLLGLLICFRYTGAVEGFLLHFRYHCKFRVSTMLHTPVQLKSGPSGLRQKLMQFQRLVLSFRQFCSFWAYRCSLRVSAMLQMSLQIRGFYYASDTTLGNLWVIWSASEITVVPQSCTKACNF